MVALLLAMLLASGIPAPFAQPLDPTLASVPRPSVVILWASWCASCRAELARVPRLAAAASVPVVTMAIDPPAVAERVLAQRGSSRAAAFADGRPPRVVLDAWGGRGSVLPLAVAIDRNGAICGRKRGLLGTDQIRDWAMRCSR